MGLCSDLSIHVFSYGHRGSADQFRTTLDQVVHCVGTKHGQDISTELDTRSLVLFPETEHDQKLLSKHELAVAKKKRHKIRLIQAMKEHKAAREAIVAADPDTIEAANAKMEIATLENNIEDAEDEMEGDMPLKLEGDEHTRWQSLLKTYSIRVDNLTKHRGQVFSLLLGQCTEMLQDHMEFHASYDEVKTSQDPLKLLDLIQQTILGHAEDTYPCAQIYN